MKRSDLDLMIQQAFRKREERLKKILDEHRRYERHRREKSTKKMKRMASKFMSIPIVIGIVAAIVMYFLYGWETLVNTLLSWIIGLTILATAIAVLEKYGSF